MIIKKGTGNELLEATLKKQEETEKPSGNRMGRKCEIR